MSIDLDSFTMTEKEGLYKAVFSRRDVRSHFIDKKIPDDVLVINFECSSSRSVCWFLAALGFYINNE